MNDRYAMMIEKLRRQAENDPSFRIKTDAIPELNGVDWVSLQNEFNIGRYILRGSPSQLREIDQMLHPWVLYGMTVLGILVPIAAAIVFQSWFMLLFAPTFYIGVPLGGISIRGFTGIKIIAVLAVLPFLIWAIYTRSPGIGACSAGFLLGVIYSSFVSSWGRVFRALLQSEELFCFFFGVGSVWINDTHTGDTVSTLTAGQRTSLLLNL